jgi:hypothetical protein
MFPLSLQPLDFRAGFVELLAELVAFTARACYGLIVPVYVAAFYLRFTFEMEGVIHPVDCKA